MRKAMLAMSMVLFLVEAMLFALSIQSAGCATILSQNFDDEPTGSVPLGWVVENPSVCSLAVNQTVYCGDSGKSARYVDSVQGDYSLVGRTFLCQEGSLILEFSMRMDSHDPLYPSPLTFYIDDGTRVPKDPIQNGANIYFGIDGERNIADAISYFDGSAHYLCPMSHDTWYRIKMVIDIPANTYDIYVDGELEAEGAHFREFGTVTQLCRIQFGCAGGKMSGYIDDIVLSSPLDSEIDMVPNTLMLGSKGRWITAYIELPEGYNVSDIDIATTLLNDTIPAEMHPTGIGDEDSDGIPDLMVKFDRETVIEYIRDNIDWSSPERTKPLIYEVTLAVEGILYNGTPFGGSDAIRTLEFLKGHPEPK